MSPNNYFFTIIKGVVPISGLMDDFTIVIEGQVGNQVAYGDIRYKNSKCFIKKKSFVRTLFRPNKALMT